DRNVTGVQTCALPIYRMEASAPALRKPDASGQERTTVPAPVRVQRTGWHPADQPGATARQVAGERRTPAKKRRRQNRAARRATRSEERRVGKEWRNLE